MGLTQEQLPRRLISGYQFYREVLGSPKYVVAPMVDQSELAWRTLSRRYGAQLAYTPMINAKLYAESSRKIYRNQNFNIMNGEEGGVADRPLIVQFCANDPQHLLAAAKMVESHCDAVDVNLGCPQDIARRGHFGSFLQDEWDLVFELVNTLHKNLSIPVTVKFRVFPTVEKTVQYAKMLESAGAQILTCHGRTREQRGHNCGLADWDKIRAVKQAVSVPVFANGNILFHSDIEACLKATGADAVMSAEGQLYNPALFVAASSSSPAFSLHSGVHPPHAELALEYLSIARELRTQPSPSAIKGHLFKLMRPGLIRETDLREQLSKIKGDGTIDEYVEIAEEMKWRMERDAKEATSRVQNLASGDASTKEIPYWLAQPYIRSLKPERTAVISGD